MPANSEFVKSLLTNPEVIALNQEGINPRQLSRSDDEVIWVSETTDAKYVNVGFFNLNDEEREIEASFKALGISGRCEVRDLWEQKDLGNFRNRFRVEINPHGAKLFRFKVL